MGRNDPSNTGLRLRRCGERRATPPFGSGPHFHLRLCVAMNAVPIEAIRPIALMQA